MSLDRPCNENIDYKEFHTTGRRLLKTEKTTMSTAQDRLAIKERSCVEDIEDFFETNKLDEIGDSLEELSESLEKIAEISKDYRHIHAELKFTLGDTRYDSIYVDTKELVGQMRQFTKDAKSEMRLLRKQESSSLETGKSEFEKKKFASEEEYSSDRLTRSLASVQVPDLKFVPEVEQVMIRLEGMFDDYLRIHCNLKVYFGDEYHDHYGDKVKNNTALFNDKTLECKSKIDELVQLEKDAETQRQNDEAERERKSQEAQDQKILAGKNEDIKIAEQSSKEIELRCTQLSAKLKVPIENMGDHQLLELSKRLNDLDIEFNEILAKVTSFSKFAIYPETDRMFQAITKSRDSVSTEKTKFVTNVQNAISDRDLSEEKMKGAANLKFELPKYKGYDSSMDIYTFKSKFEKLVQPQIQKKLWVDTLKLNYLMDPALSLVKKVEDIGEIWQKLEASYGNTRLLLQKKLSALEKHGGLSKLKGEEKLIIALSKLINAMTELRELATTHSLQNELYYGGAIERILAIVGEWREKRFIKNNLDVTLSKEQEWNKLSDFLKEELKLHEKLLLNTKSKQCLGIEPLSSTPKKKDEPGSYRSDIEKYDKPTCHICGKHDHMSYKSPYSGRFCVSYFACRLFVEKSPADRLKLLEEKGLCRQCLTPGAKIGHSNKCHDTFCCKDASHSKTETGYHVLVCERHKNKNENLDLLQQFKTKVIAKYEKELPQFSRNIRITFFGDQEYESDEVIDRGVFMLQKITIENETFNIFYDSGCGDLVCKKSAIEKLKLLGRATQISPGPIILSGVGDNKSICHEGIYKIRLPLPGGKNAHMSGLCLDTVTGSFPVHALGGVEEDIRSHYLKHEQPELPGNWPKCPEWIGGETDIMIGITYRKYFPKELYRLPSGLSILESAFTSSDGSRGVIAGPHPNFSPKKSNYFSPSVSYWCSPECNLYNKKCQLALETPLLGIQNIEGKMLEAVVDSESYASRKRPPKISKTFEQVENAGTEITYRCMDCRGCPDCKKSDRFESISIQEEIEQTVIERSVKVDITKRQTTAKLPFMSSPTLRLRPNKGIAMRIYQSQVRKLMKNPEDMDAVIQSERKLHELGFVKFVDELSPADKKMITDSEVKYFLPWRAVWKPDSLSTDCRLVFDASHSPNNSNSLNDLLAKGTNNMNNLVQILIKWSIRKCGFHTDIRKMYNTIHLEKPYWCYQLYLWSDEFDIDNPKWKVITTLIYGIVSSGNQAECGLRMTAKLMEELYERVCEIIYKEIYVDDCISGGNDLEEVRMRTDELKLVLEKGGFTLKGVTISGEEPPPHLSADGESVCVGGMKWFPKGDFLKLNIGVLNFSKKERGRKSSSQVGLIPESFTRRHCVGKVSEIFDPLGRVSPILAGMKIDINELSSRKLEWDDPIPSDLKTTWIKIFQTIQELQNVEFHRTVIPENAVDLNIETIDTADASNKLVCVAIYARFRMKNGGFSCQLVFARTKVVPKDMSMPRAELLAATINATSGHVVKISFGKYFSKALKLTDSQIFLHWINCTRSELRLWVRNRVIEILRLSDINMWRYVRSGDMIADLGTRKGAEISDVSKDSEWNTGKSWMKGEECDFPVKTVKEIILTNSEKSEVGCESTKPALIEELNCFFGNVVPSSLEKRFELSQYIISPNRYRFRTAIRILALVFRYIHNFCAKWGKGKPSEPSEEKSNLSSIDLSYFGSRYLVTNGSRYGNTFGCPGGRVVCMSDEDISSAITYFFRKATNEIKTFVPPNRYKDISEEKEGILYYSGRILSSDETGNKKEMADVMFDLSSTSFCVPLTDKNSPIAYSIVDEVHMHDKTAKHTGLETVLRYTQNIAYIIEGRDLAKRYGQSCILCRIRKKKALKLKMGPIPDSSLKIAPAFFRSQVDLFGPFDSYSNLHKRKTVKIYFVIFCCTVTSAIDIKTMEDYSTESFLLAFVRFACRYGYPKFLLPDEGSQLVKGCESMILNFVDLKHQLNTEYSIQFETCPVGAHYMHGKVERKIQQVKKSMSLNMAGKRLSIMQWESLGHEVANCANNLPLGLKNKVEDIENLDILTPNRLLLGRNNDRCPSGPFQATDDLKTFLTVNREIYETWFKSWLISYVPCLMDRPKWHNSDENVKVGDVVLFLKSDKEFCKDYQYGMIKNVFPSKDGCIRKVEVEYQNSTENVKRCTSRCVRELIIVHPVDELSINEQLAEFDNS